MFRQGVFLVCFVIGACATAPTETPTAPAAARNTPIGEILRKYATERSYQECKTENLSPEECKQKLAEAERHLESVNARVEALLKDPRTNQCDMVRFLGRCEDPVNTLGDLADCLQVTPDRGELINSGRVAFNLDSRGCPTSNKPISIPPELTGIWSTQGTEFHGDAVANGDAIYLDSDGIGAFVRGKDAAVVVARFQATLYNPENGAIAYQITENGQVSHGDSLTYDERDHGLVIFNDGPRYHRHSDAISSTTRQELGLAPRMP